MEQPVNPDIVVNNFLSEFGTTIGLELSLDHNGICTLEFATGFRCSIELPENSSTVYLLAPMVQLQEISESGQCQFFKRILELNFCSLETRGATFALDKQQVILCFAQPVASLDTSADFINLLSRFIETGIRWFQEFNQPMGEQKPDNRETTDTAETMPGDPRFWV